MADTPLPKSDLVSFGELLISFDLEKWTTWIGDWGVSRALFLSTIYVALLFVLNTQIPNFLLITISWIFGTAPVWLPIALVISAYKVWIWYARSLYISKIEYVFLEMKIPREITKSPRAMETVLTDLWLTDAETTFIHRFIKGQVRTTWSFEITSFGGEIHFYVRTPKAYRTALEGAFYSQYPEIELVEVEDYSLKFQFDPEKYTCYGFDWRLEGIVSGDNPAINAYPMKSYIDFELDKDPKEEFKIDPLGTVLEFLGSIKPTEQLWLQLVFRASIKTGVVIRKDTMWKHIIETEVQKIRLESAVLPAKMPIEISPERLQQARPRATWKQTQQVEAMERHLGKHPFDFGARGIYIAPPEDFGRTFWNFRFLWRPYANAQYMSWLRPRRWHNDYDYPWQDFHDFRWINDTRRFLDAYRRRMFFYAPWTTPYNMLSSESIASIFHPPSRSVTTPGIIRIPATKAEPPANLPR